MPALRFLSRAASATASLFASFGTPAFAADSSLDSAFVTEISPGLTPTSYPTFNVGTGAVNAVALQSDGKILAGGNLSRFTTADSVRSLALDSAGRIDVTGVENVPLATPSLSSTPAPRFRSQHCLNLADIKILSGRT